MAGCEGSGAVWYGNTGPVYTPGLPGSADKTGGGLSARGTPTDTPDQFKEQYYYFTCHWATPETLTFPPVPARRSLLPHPVKLVDTRACFGFMHVECKK